MITASDAKTPRPRATAPAPMSLGLALDLGMCGALLVGLSFLAKHQQPDFPHLTFLILVAGGGLSILWGILGRFGIPCRLGAMMTLAVMACVLACQAVQTWQIPAGDALPDRTLPFMMTGLAVLCAGTLANLIRERKALPP